MSDIAKRDDQAASSEIRSNIGSVQDELDEMDEEERETRELRKMVECLNRILELSLEESEHYKALALERQETFLAKSAVARKSEMERVAKAAAEADPVIDTIDGIEYRKSDGNNMIALAKSLHETRKENLV